jgi:hypothetical protein
LSYSTYSAHASPTLTKPVALSACVAARDATPSATFATFATFARVMADITAPAPGKAVNEA